MATTEEVETALDDAISRALPGEFVTRWVAVVEVIDGDGDRVLWTLADPALAPWDRLGLLHFAEAREVAAISDDPDGE